MKTGTHNGKTRVADCPSVAGARRRKARRMTFGSVTVTVTPPSESDVRKSVRDSRTACRMMMKALSSSLPIRLPHRSDVPLFRASPEHPTLVIRTLNGREQEGKFIKGAFTVVHA